jgi:REP element-mobilizing transposase RayT
MSQDPYYLDEARRRVVLDAIVAESRFRRWNILALHVRTNHVHLVVTADREPEFVMRSCKANASKCLNKAGFEDTERKRWTTHGSTRYLWDEIAVAGAVDYTLNQQGEALAVYRPPAEK